MGADLDSASHQTLASDFSIGSGRADLVRSAQASMSLKDDFGDAAYRYETLEWRRFIGLVKAFGICHCVAASAIALRRHRRLLGTEVHR